MPTELRAQFRIPWWASVHATAANSECPTEPWQPTSLAASFSSQVRFFSQVTSAHTLLGELGEQPLGQISPKGEKTCPDSRPTRMQNFTPLALSVWWDRKESMLSRYSTYFHKKKPHLESQIQHLVQHGFWTVYHHYHQIRQNLFATNQDAVTCSHKLPDYKLCCVNTRCN